MQKENDELLNGSAYEAPKCEIIEVQNEGVLCGSADSQATHDPYGDSTSYGW